MAEPAPTSMSYAEYLAAEQASAAKHEYLRGEVYAMAGGTPTHSRLTAAVITSLSVALADRPCSVFSSDLRIRIEATELSTYPDITVVCGTLRGSEIDAQAVTNPIVIVEVLSDSTEAYDRGEKFAHYRRLTSLCEYVLVSQREPRVEAYFKNDAGHWELSEAGPGESLLLRSLERVELVVDAVYRDPLT